MVARSPRGILEGDSIEIKIFGQVLGQIVRKVFGQTFGNARYYSVFESFEDNAA